MKGLTIPVLTVTNIAVCLESEVSSWLDVGKISLGPFGALSAHAKSINVLVQGDMSWAFLHHKEVESKMSFQRRVRNSDRKTTARVHKHLHFKNSG